MLPTYRSLRRPVLSLMSLMIYFRGSARFCDSRGGSGTSGTQFTSSVRAAAAAAAAANAAAPPVSPIAAAAGANERSNNSLAENAETANGYTGGISRRVRSVRLMPDPRYGQVTNRAGDSSTFVGTKV